MSNVYLKMNGVKYTDIKQINFTGDWPEKTTKQVAVNAYFNLVKEKLSRLNGIEGCNVYININDSVDNVIESASCDNCNDEQKQLIIQGLK